MLCFRLTEGAGFGAALLLLLLASLAAVILTALEKLRRLQFLSRRHTRIYQAEIVSLELTRVPSDLMRAAGNRLKPGGRMKLRWNDDTDGVREETFPLSPKLYRKMLGKGLTTQLAVVRDPKIPHEYKPGEQFDSPALRRYILSRCKVPLSGEIVLLAEERNAMRRNSLLWLVLGVLAAALLIRLLYLLIFNLWVRGYYIWQSVTK